MSATTLLPIHCFSFSFFLSFLLCFYSLVRLLFFYSSIVEFSPTILFCVLIIPHCAQRRLLLYCLLWSIFTILPIDRFCLGVGVLPDHPLVCQPPNQHHLPMLAVPYPITRQRVLFCLFAHCGILIRIRVGIFSHYPSWNASSDSNSFFPILGGMSSQ